MTSYLLRGVRVLGDPATDLLLRDGVIAAAGKVSAAAAKGAEVVDADGLVALPGLVDLHTHLREPGREDAETVDSGSRAAALGGYLAARDPATDGTLRWRIEQGFEMNRPSLIDLEVDKVGGEITSVRVEGEAVMVMRGEVEM